MGFNRFKLHGNATVMVKWLAMDSPYSFDGCRVRELTRSIESYSTVQRVLRWLPPIELIYLKLGVLNEWGPSKGGRILFTSDALCRQTHSVDSKTVDQDCSSSEECAQPDQPGS